MCRRQRLFGARTDELNVTEVRELCDGRDIDRDGIVGSEPEQGFFGGVDGDVAIGVVMNILEHLLKLGQAFWLDSDDDGGYVVSGEWHVEFAEGRGAGVFDEFLSSILNIYVLAVCACGGAQSSRVKRSRVKNARRFALAPLQ